ncbi:MAG: RsmD family RNA methyltransferase, partial [Gemmatimonadaceae bacterium]
ASADFVESDPRVFRVLRGNTELLDAGRAAVVHRGDAIRFAAELSGGEYDITFADPPYAGGWAATLAEVWLATPFSRILSIEHEAREKLSGAVETRRYGSSAITFYRSEV